MLVYPVPAPTPQEKCRKKKKDEATHYSTYSHESKNPGFPSENELVIKGDMRWDRERVIGESSQKQGIHGTYIVRPETAFLLEIGARMDELISMHRSQSILTFCCGLDILFQAIFASRHVAKQILNF